MRTSMQSDLLDLKNLGNTSINWLHAIGINSLEDLQIYKVQRLGIEP